MNRYEGGERVEEALRESEARYRAFVTASSDVVYRMGPDWSEMRQLDGRGFISDTAEPTEHWMERYIHPDDRPLVRSAIEEAVRKEDVFELEHRVVRVDGTLGWTLSRAVPILGDGGEIVEWLGTASDVTERREAEEALRESEARAASFRELSVDIMSTASFADGHWHSVNPAFERILDWSELEALRMPFMDIVHPEDLERSYDAMAGLARGEMLTDFEHRVLCKDGSYRWIAWHTSADPEEGLMYCVGRDVTERRAAEAERERLGSLSEASARAEASERERISRELHDRVAHGIGVAYQSLELFSALRETDPERAEEKLELAREATRMALDRTRNISAELKRLQDEELAEGLQAAFEKLADTFAPDGTAMEVSFSGDQSAVAPPVGMQVYLAMREAVRNAVRHSGCSRIAVRLVVEDGELRARVEDDGEGFDPDTAESTPTLGVGLRSMRERAESLGGTLRVDSEPEKGTRVEMRVPLDGLHP